MLLISVLFWYFLQKGVYMKELKIIYDKPENLIPYVNNNKYHSDDQILRLAASIQAFGFDQPIIVDKNNVIIKGHARRTAALQLKMKEVPVIVADHLDEYETKAARIADNKTSSNEYNLEAIKFDIGTLNLKDFNLALTGLQPIDIEAMLSDISNDPVFEKSIIGEFQNMQENKANEIIQPVAENINTYSDKIQTPIYEPNGEKPVLNDLIDLNKYKSLCADIEKSTLNKEEKEFLKLAASRHIVFNYEKIANYYAHSEKPVQELFENSALVIIDFDKAVENGFVKLSKEMNDSYVNNEEDEE